MTSIEKFRSAIAEPERQEESHECWCCRDTGLVVETWKLRDESSYPFSSTLPAMVCKGFPFHGRRYCKAIYDRLRSWEIRKEDGVEREATTNTFGDIEFAIQQRYDTSATHEQCQKLHWEAQEDAFTRKNDSEYLERIQCGLNAIRKRSAALRENVPVEGVYS